MRISFWSRRTFEAFIGGERVARIVKRAMPHPLLGLLTGVEQVIDVEIHGELTLERRTLLLVAALLLDRRYF